MTDPTQPVALAAAAEPARERDYQDHYQSYQGCPIPSARPELVQLPCGLGLVELRQDSQGYWEAE